MPKKQSEGNDLNIGTRLYQKGIKKIQEKERLLEEEKKKQEEKAVEGLTFKPQHRCKSREKFQGQNGGVKKEVELM